MYKRENKKVTRAIIEAAFLNQLKQRDLWKWDSNHCINPEDNTLLQARNKVLWWDEVGQGDGNELTPDSNGVISFCSILSSTALVINSFAPWKRHGLLDKLEIEVFGRRFSGFECMKFEHKAHNGLRGNDPNLDVWLPFSKGVLAIESKFCEIVEKYTKAGFSTSYVELSKKLKIEDSPWIELMHSIQDGNLSFNYLKVEQLIKHFFGIIQSSYSEKHLLYLYWHPSNDSWVNLDPYKVHESELETLHEMLEGTTDVFFHSLSYQELWGQWSDYNDEEVKYHVDSLENRYHLCINES